MKSLLLSELLLLLLFVQENQVSAQRPPEIRQLEARILNHRRSLHSGEVELHSRLIVKKGQLAGQAREVKCHIYFSGQDIRGDFTEEYNPLGTGKGGDLHQRVVACSLADGVFRLYSDQELPVRRPAEIRSPDDSIADLYHVPDPRKLGMLPSNLQLYKYRQLNYLCNNESWSLVDELNSESFRGIECRRLRYRRPPPSPGRGASTPITLTVWISPRHDDSIIGMECTWDDSKARIECEMEEIDGYGWFPKFIEFNEWDDGELDRTEELSVTVVQFNEPVDPVTFRFAGMGMPPDLPVNNFTDVTEFVNSNDGAEPTVVQSESGRAPSASLAENDGLGRVLLILNSIVVVILASLLVLRYMRS